MLLTLQVQDANGSPSTQGTCLVYLLSTVAGEILRPCIHFAVVNELKYLELRKLYLNSKKLPPFLRKRNGIESKIKKKNAGPHKGQKKTENKLAFSLFIFNWIAGL